MTKIYTSITIDIGSGEVLREESFLHAGPVAMCKGGSSTSVTNTYDPAYNARMATVAEGQQKIADQYFDFWRSEYQPMESEQIKANRQLVQPQTELQLSQIAAAKELLPGQTELQLAQNDAAMKLLPELTGASLQSLALAREGVDENAAASRAATDVAVEFSKVQDANLRTLARRGGIGSGASLAQLSADAMEQAKATAMAKGTARRQAKTDSFNMLAKVTGKA